MEGKSFDLVVIGSGPGGYVAAIYAAQKGLKTALVEKDSTLGGTCLNRGCIPTKALLQVADSFKKTESFSKRGIELSQPAQLSLPGVMDYKDQLVGDITKGVAFLMKKNQVEVFQDYGVVQTPQKVWLKNREETLESRFILLASGSRPRGLPFAPFDGERILSSDHILELREHPQSLGIIGAGVIGLEFASCWGRYGTSVTIFERLDRIAPLEDGELVQGLQKALTKQNCTFQLGCQIEKIEVKTEGVGLTYDGGKEQVVDRLLVAIGREPVLDEETQKNLQLVCEPNGCVPVDLSSYQTTSGVYAIGDLICTPQLAHTASREALLAVDHMVSGSLEPFNYALNPNVIYTSPEIASVGETEEQLKKKGMDYKKSVFPFSAVAKAKIDQASDGFIKLLTGSQYGEILGVHILNAKASEMISEFALGQVLETTVEELAQAVHPHPTLSEIVGEVAHLALGHPLHI